MVWSGLVWWCGNGSVTPLVYQLSDSSVSLTSDLSYARLGQNIQSDLAWLEIGDWWLTLSPLLSSTSTIWLGG